jgi:hypothetical protein
VRQSRLLLATVLGVAAIATSALAIRPSAKADAGRIDRHLFDGAQIDAKTLGIVERACQNCHSDVTQWPWYSYLPPGSWLIHRDVARARDRFNLSRWESYPVLEKQALLSAIGAAARTGVMPPSRYTFLHPKSVLSQAEREGLYRWTRAERSRLRNLGVPSRRSGAMSFVRGRRVRPARFEYVVAPAT